MPNPEYITIHVNKYVTAILAFSIGPLVVLLVYLDNRPLINAGWLNLDAICIIVSAFLTIRVFPFSNQRPKRILLRFYLTFCLIITFMALDLHEPRIPVITDVIILWSLILILICGYRPGFDVFLRRKGKPDKETKRL
jgi:hypothetical protein